MHRMGPLLKLLLLLALSRAPISAAETETTSAGLQANFGDVSFAGGMSYDPEHQIIYVTGQVGPHSCFVGILKRVAAATTKSPHPTHLEFLSRQVFNERGICQTIAYRQDVSRPGNALLLSLSEEGGLLTDQREEGSRKARQYGGLLSLEYTADGSSSEFHPDKSVLIYPAAVTIPRSIANDPTRTNRVFIATMTSENTQIRYTNALGSPHESDGGGGGVTTHPNLTPGGGMLKYGKSFAMTVESVRLATDFSSAEPQWRKPFGTKPNSDEGKGVTVNQILFRQESKQDDADAKSDDALFVVGSTLGSGPAFGQPELDNDRGYGLAAGFITKLDPNSGSVITSRRFLLNLQEYAESPVQETYIEAVCNGSDDEDAIYIVGSYDRSDSVGRHRILESQEKPAGAQTVPPSVPEALDDDHFDDDVFNDDDEVDDEDEFVDDDVFNDDDEVDDEVVDEDEFVDDDVFKDDDEFDDDEFLDDDIFDDDDDFDGSFKESKPDTIATPFVAKLRASTLETIWQKDFESNENARALGCGVDPKLNAVYVAGNMENGGNLVGLTTSMQGDDVFLLRLDTASGDVSWSKQLGTSSDDRLAYGGSGLVVLEDQQGILLMGDTTSDLFSLSKKDSEVFIVEIDSDGNVPATTEKTGIDNSPDEYLVKLSSPTKTGGGDQSDSGSGKNTKPDAQTSDNAENSVVSVHEHAHKIYIVVGVGIVAFALLGCYFHISQKKKREATERALVFSYLQGFDLEDIDVKQAATGGWHGTYVGTLANGVNHLENNNETRSESDGSFDCGDQEVEQKLSKLSHSSVVRDILFMDYDDSVFSSVNADKSKDSEDQRQEKDGIIRDPDDIAQDDEDDRKVDPWGTEI
eukprot:CAMPEP_0116104360 /NCGR_PEP_ID=MMETSP0327-20121206/14409_1 /TAXON_ID=44447 /ORGANISM="Pseudo-nitzschia delicatissima, Strain B596" /LENGTH=863 /DNA_ID=CAMNT_0003596597 /DNA_START=273 /DNA_END=2861 /DNA_ORIENTATION=-